MMIAPAAAIGIEVSGLYAMLREIAGCRACFCDRACRAYMVCRDAVAEQGKNAGACNGP